MISSKTFLWRIPKYGILALIGDFEDLGGCNINRIRTLLLAVNNNRMREIGGEYEIITTINK